VNAVSDHRNLTVARFLQDNTVLLTTHDGSVNRRTGLAQELLSRFWRVLLRQDAADLELDHLLIASHAAIWPVEGDREVVSSRRHPSGSSNEKPLRGSCLMSRLRAVLMSAYLLLESTAHPSSRPSTKAVEVI
jgi:hypothetical protein